MTVSPAVSPPGRDAFAVEPVVEYEPPTRDVPRNVGPCRQAAQAISQRRNSRAPRRPYVGRRVDGPTATVPVLSAPMRQAAIFADAALRRVLEVIDRRRPASQLRPLLVAGLVDAVLSVSGSPTSARCVQAAAHEGVAVLRRMRLQPVGHRDHETAAEIFGCYSRGDRMHAIACRVEKLHAGNGARWQVVALHIG
ncbi:Rv3235 family protein [Mycobacterium numidiamassiliense]|nr:Rv3235 family protein [Mycobacterium numidiamassiliense]